jgi:hypothetical protein
VSPRPQLTPGDRGIEPPRSDDALVLLGESGDPVVDRHASGDDQSCFTQRSTDSAEPASIAVV